MNRYKKIIITLLFITIFVPLTAESGKINIDEMELFNERLKDNEKEILASGGILLRSISSMKKLCVKNSGKAALVITPMSEKIKSGYIAEIINFKPYKGNEDLIERLNEIVSDFLSYTEIQCYSKRYNEYFSLYDYAEVIDTTKKENITTINELFEMSLFGRFHAQIDIENYTSYFIYKLKNKDKLKFHGWLPVVSQEKMQSVVAVFRVKDNWMIYAVGGADVIRVPFITSRAEPAFISRVKGFTDFVFSKLEKNQETVESTLDESDKSAES